MRKEITKSFQRLLGKGDSRQSGAGMETVVARRDLREGCQFGSYRILKRLGSGGMGEVYLALDTRLGRQAALKFLPSDLTSNDEMLCRFAHEARAASALNHPNILTIYDIGEIDGEHFIASEYIEGVTLGTAMQHGVLDPGTVLDIATQVASALSAAHSAGVVHRDLKPGNIMIRPDGYVKVIDFGLAKLAPELSRDGSLDASWTRAGSLMGTVDYMSPEQARGEELDARTDLWSLGVVLYEMAVHKRPFEGETDSHVLVAILDQPVGPVAGAKSLPRGLLRIIDRALTKDRAKRYQTAHEMLTDLQEVSRSSGLASSVRPMAFARQTRLSRTATIAVALLAFVICGLAVWWWEARTPEWFRIESVRQLTFNGRTKLACISPDGKYLAFVVGDPGGTETLYLKQVDQASEEVRISARKIEYESITISPDSQTIYEVEKDSKLMGRLYALPLVGDRPSFPILVDIDGAISFSPSGNTFSFVRHREGRSSVLEIAKRDGSGRQVLFSPSGAVLSVHQAWSPNENKIATFLYSYRTGETTLDLIDLNGRETKRVLPGWRGVGQPVWTARGETLIVPVAMRTQGTVQLKEIALKDGQVQDFTKDLAGYSGASITRDGQELATVKAETKASLWISARNDVKSGESTTAEVEDFPTLAWSDEDHIIMSSQRNGFPNLWLYDVAGQSRATLTNEPFVEQGAVVLPTKSIVFASNRSGQFHLYKFDPQGNEYTQLTSGATYDEAPSLTPDGKWIVYTSWTVNNPHLRKVPANGGDSMQIGNYLARDPEISPDGKWIACQLQDPKTSQWSVAVVPFNEQGPARAIANAQPPVRWSSDGASLMSVLTNSRGVSNVWLVPLDGSAPRQLTRFEDDRILKFAWSPAGDRLACIRGTRGADAVIFKRQK